MPQLLFCNRSEPGVVPSGLSIVLPELATLELRRAASVDRRGPLPHLTRTKPGRSILETTGR
jgi:hypothetical protein